MIKKKIRVRKPFYKNMLVHRFCNSNKGYTPRALSSMSYLNRWYYPNITNSAYLVEDPLYTELSFSGGEYTDFISFPKNDDNNENDWIYFNPLLVSRIINNSYDKGAYIKTYLKKIEVFQKHLKDLQNIGNFPEYDTRRLVNVGICEISGSYHHYSFPFRESCFTDPILPQYYVLESRFESGLYYKDNVFYYIKNNDTRPKKYNILESWTFTEGYIEWSSMPEGSYIYLGIDNKISPLYSLYLPELLNYASSTDTSSIIVPSYAVWCNKKITMVTDTSALRYNYTCYTNPNVFSSFIQDVCTYINSEFSMSLTPTGGNYVAISKKSLLESRNNITDYSNREYDIYRTTYAIFNSLDYIDLSDENDLPQNVDTPDYSLYYWWDIAGIQKIFVRLDDLVIKSVTGSPTYINEGRHFSDGISKSVLDLC